MSRILLTLAITFGIVFTLGLWIPLKAMVAQELLTLAWAESQARLQLGESAQPLIVLAGAHGESLAFGPGHVTGSAEPGMRGPVVIAGHRDTHFRGLETVDIDSTIRLQSRSGKWSDYRVTQLRVADSRQEAMNLATMPDNSLLLVTCYPFNSIDNQGPLRYLVEARKVEPSPARATAGPNRQGLADTGF
ncbi:sortase [Marinobacter changyiensis]|uniref:sortase n=1 Tax=Marinobacter changyiensis TaxID=2604091 RepID=UPI00126512BF|nr:sortase [Marinobacter changyiensis]